MTIPSEYSFQRYLAAKKSLDDRSLNRRVWDVLNKEVKQKEPPLRILEIGAGIGTMIERVVEWDLVSNATYSAVDRYPQNLQFANNRLAQWTRQRGLIFEQVSEDRVLLHAPGTHINVEFKPIDLYDFDKGLNTGCRYDLVIAHAFLDLVDISRALPFLFDMLDAGGLYYFSINFDGLTILEPHFDREFDELLLRLYHHNMDKRRVDGKPSGDSRTGRHLFTQIRQLGVHILEIGASDWIVYPQSGLYLADEAYFLHFIIHTIHSSLDGNSQINRKDLQQWADKRHQQIERGELVYLAHQLDYVGKV